MMNSDQVLDELDAIAKITTKKEKQAAVKAGLQDPLFRRVCHLACNSFVTFGMTSSVSGDGQDAFTIDTPDIWGTLDKFASRDLTGGAAKMVYNCTMSGLSAKSGQLLNRILDKDLRCAVTSTILNEVEPGFIPVFEVMLAHKFEDKRFISGGMAAEPKKDGVRVTCLVRNGEVRFLSRTGKPFPAIAHLASDVLQMVREALAIAQIQGRRSIAAYLGSPIGNSQSPCIVLDGEMVSGSFNKTVGDVRRKSVEASDAVFEIFDAIPYDDFMQHEIVPIAFEKRRDALEDLFRYGAPSKRLSLIEQRKVLDTPAAYEAYTEWRTQGFEGAMIKALNAPYAKKRSHAWLKMKAQETEDLRVIHKFEGTGKYVGKLGGLIVRRMHEGREVDVRVGGGFTDAQRDSFWFHFRDDVEGRLIEVEYHEITPDGSLRHPRFCGFRDDKDRGSEFDKQAAE